jgi:DNA-binding NtrC family response regulator
MSSKKILVVDDAREVRDLMKEFLAGEGFEVSSAHNGLVASRMVGREDFDMVITDIRMPKMDGMKLLETIKRTNPQVIVIVITGYGTIDAAVRAMRLGAYEYITKPVMLDELRLVIHKAFEHQQLRSDNRMLQRQLKTKYRFKNFIGDSDIMQEIFRFIEKIANTDSTVLVYGDSGTGKELVARAIHYNSDRCQKPLIPVNCGAIPEDLLESELFGYEKGAFTGALKTRMGRFELANGGTVFLDEIGDMSPALQVKILRVLQGREFERVGGVKTIKVDIRVIAATNKDLEKAVAEGKFREDLYYRLNVIPVVLPPLRERKSDIPLLINHCIKRFKQEKRLSVEGMTEEAVKYFMDYSWPGNVRELENLIERLVILKGKGVVDVDDLPDKLLGHKGEVPVPEIRIPEDGIPFNAAVSQFERELILQALNRTDWVKNRAAKLLHLNRTTLVEKMKKIKLQREQPS